MHFTAPVAADSYGQALTVVYKQLSCKTVALFITLFINN